MSGNPIKNAVTKLLRAYVGDSGTHQSLQQRNIAPPKTHVEEISASHQGSFGGNITYRHGNSKQSGGHSRFGLTRYVDHLYLNHYAIRQNTRVAVHKSIQARMILERKNTVTIGTGIRPDPSPLFKILGITPKEAKEIGEEFKEFFELWADSKDSDLLGINNYWQNQSFSNWQFGRDGEYFERITYTDDPDLISPVQISFIDPNQIRGNEFTMSAGPTTQDTGLIPGKNGKTKAFKVWIPDTEKEGHFKDIIIDAVDKETGRPLMLHCYKPEWVGQKRGIAKISYALQMFQDMTIYTDSTIKKAIQDSSLGFIIQNKDQTPSDVGYTSAVDQESGNEVPQPSTKTLTERVTESVLKETTFDETGPRNIFGAEKGDELIQLKHNTPPESSGQFVKDNSKFLCALVQMPFTVGIMEMGKAHSASRAELGMLKDVIDVEVADQASDNYKPIYDVVISEAIAAGKLKAPGFSDPLLRRAWLNVNWKSKSLPDIDPLKTVLTIEKAIQLGLTDFDAAAKSYNGSNGEANRARIAEQLPQLMTDPYGILALENQAKNLEAQQKEDDKNDNGEN